MIAEKKIALHVQRQGFCIVQVGKGRDRKSLLKGGDMTL